MDPKLTFQLTGDKRGISLPSIALDPNRHLHEVSENRGNVLPSIFPHLQNQGAAASVDGPFSVGKFFAKFEEGNQSIKPVSVTEVEKALLSEIEKKPPREKPHTKPRRSSDPSANYPPTETRKPRKGSELKGGSRKRNDSEGNLESKSPKPKDLKQAQAISSPTRSVESNQNQSPAQQSCIVRLPKVSFNETGSAGFGLRTRRKSSLPTLKEASSEDPNTLIDIDKKIESGFASLKISNSTESTLPKIDDTPQREVVYKHESKSDDNKSSKDDVGKKVTSEFVTGDDILAAGNISLEALKDHQESLIQGARMNETIVVEPALEVKEELDEFPFSQADVDLEASVTMNETVGAEWKELLTSPKLTLNVPKDPVFAPVDVCKGKTTTFVTCQVTNEIARFDGKEFKGMMKRTEARCFDCPRYVMAVPGLLEDPSDCIIIILDNIGIHVFYEDGNFIESFCLGQGFKYRGLALYKCMKGIPFLVTMNVGSPKTYTGVSVCIFAFTEKFCSVRQKKKIPISSTFNTPDPKCRFIAVKSDCDESAAICGGHTAFVTALESRCIYMVDLVSGISKVVSLETSSYTADNTFHFAPPNPSGDEESRPITPKQPTGICFDKSGNILVADKMTSVIYFFAPNGLHLRTFKLLGQPVGLFYKHDEDELYVADNSGKQVLVFSDFANKLS